MPTLTELRRRYTSGDRVEANPFFAGDEVLIADRRGRLTPAQFVEQKLQGLLVRRAAASGTSGDPRSKVSR
jgi:hypothetical protein